MGTKQKQKFRGIKRSYYESHKSTGSRRALVKARRALTKNKRELFRHKNMESIFTIDYCVHMKGITTTWAYSAL